MGSVLSTEQQKPHRGASSKDGWSRHPKSSPMQLGQPQVPGGSATALAAPGRGGGTCIWAVPPAPSSLVPQRGMLRHIPAVPDGVPNLSSSSNLKWPQNPKE